MLFPERFFNNPPLPFTPGFASEERKAPGPELPIPEKRAN